MTSVASDRRVTSFPIGRLETVFSPSGLPLVAKAAGQPPTTSVAVVGAAGSGKTTFALAVAHGIARSAGGRTLVLLVESSAAEIEHKAALLGLPSTGIESDGFVDVVTLPPPVGGAQPPTSGELLASALDEVWNHVETSAADLPIRSILLDGVLVEDGNPGVSRVDFARWVHGLEQLMGVSPVVIVESNDRSAGLHEFVCDVVFRLERGMDPETRQISTQLLLTKCRHSLSLPGPHSYGVRRGRLELLPDFAAVARSGLSTSRRSQLPPVLLPRKGEVPLLLQTDWSAVLGLPESAALTAVAVAAGVHVQHVDLAGLAPQSDLWAAIDSDASVLNLVQWERASEVVRRTAEGLLRSAGHYGRQIFVTVGDVATVVTGVDCTWVGGKLEPSPHSARALPLDRSPAFFDALPTLKDLSFGPPTERWLLEYVSYCAIASRNAEWWPVIERLGTSTARGLDGSLLRLVLLAAMAVGTPDDNIAWIPESTRKARVPKEEETSIWSQCEELRQVVQH
jgi:KaiC/GvpD/RAD55 family RecA-like ATPase